MDIKGKVPLSGSRVVTEPSDPSTMKCCLGQPLCKAAGLPAPRGPARLRAAAEMKSDGRLDAVGWDWTLGVSLSGL